MVHAHGAVAEELMQLVQGIADHRRGQMADVEALGDVDGRIVQHDGLAFAGIVAAVVLALGHGAVDHLLGEGGAVDEEVQIALDGLDSAQIVGGNRPGQRVGDHHRAFAQRLGQLEAGKGVIAHGRVRRNLQRGGDLVAAQRGRAKDGGQRVDDLLRDGKLEIHIVHSRIV